MLNHVINVGSKRNLPELPENERSQWLRERLYSAERGLAFLAEVLSGRPPETSRRSDVMSHLVDMSWGLLNAATAQGKPYIGGSVVLEDRGAIHDFIVGRMGGEVHDRLSTHFNERRLTSWGLDADKKNEKFALEKGTLHFGKLSGTNHTFIKFEYFGVRKISDKFWHTVELIEVLRGNSEQGFREGISSKLHGALKDFINKNHVLRKYQKAHHRDLDGMTLAKSGIAYVQKLIEGAYAGDTTFDRAQRKLLGSQLADRIFSIDPQLSDSLATRQGSEIILRARDIDNLLRSKRERSGAPEGSGSYSDPNPRGLRLHETPPELSQRSVSKQADVGDSAGDDEKSNEKRSQKKKKKKAKKLSNSR